jgi:DNA polymerase-3 subunit epsilon
MMVLYGSLFYSLDVETANTDSGSICQIGIGRFEHGELTGTWKSYIDPGEHFNHHNVRVHGIDSDMVQNAPKFYEVYGFLRRTFEHNIVVHHAPFDRVAFGKAYRKYNLEPFPVKWLDSSTVARRTWKQFSKTGYGLHNLAEFLDIKFKHHDALEDSVTAGKIVVAACRERGVGVEELMMG